MFRGFFSLRAEPDSKLEKLGHGSKSLSLFQILFMQQLVLDISSDKDADLIKELLTRFKGVEVNSFSSDVNARQMQKRIYEGLKQADEGKLKPWKDVKAGLLKRIKSNGR